MAEHVDILKTGSVQPLARVVLDDGRVTVLADDREYWQNLLEHLVLVDPGEDPEGFLHAVYEKVDSTYVYATPPHDEGDDSCPVPDAPWSQYLPAPARA